MSLFLIIPAAAAALYLSMQGEKQKTVIIEDKTVPPTPKKTTNTTKKDPVPTVVPTTTTTDRTWLYAKEKGANIYKTYSVSHVKTALTLSKDAIYEGEYWLTGIPSGMFIGLPTGQKKNNLVQFKMNLSGKDYLAWVDEKDVLRSSKLDNSRMKNATIINRIISRY
jgi:hypothetical protein